MSKETVGKRSVFFIHHWIFLQLENDTNLLIQESFTLRDGLRFRICIEKYPFFQVKFLCSVWLSSTKKKIGNTLLALGHIHIRARTDPDLQAAHIVIIYNCVQIQKTCISVEVYNKILCSIPSWADWWFLLAIQCLKSSYIARCSQFYSVL